jgi:hypothetical protein
MLYQFMTMDDSEILQLQSRDDLHEALTPSLLGDAFIGENSHVEPTVTHDSSLSALSLQDFMTSSSHIPRLLPFPYRLHHMLSDVQKRAKDHIVSWMPNGRTFKIHKPREFVGDVASCYFNLTQYKSFTRQLLNYGFKRAESGQSCGKPSLSG